MVLKYDGKNITNFRVDGKSVNSIYFGGKKVLSEMLSSGTVLFNNDDGIVIPKGKTIEISLKKVKTNLTNINLKINLTGKRIGKKFYSTMTKDQLTAGVTLTWGLKAKLVQGTNKIAFNYDDGENGLAVIKLELV